MSSTNSSAASADELILEGIVLSCDAQGQLNIAPMGPRVDRQLSQFVLKPFCTSQTFRNLQATRAAVFHITDDVELLSHAAVGEAKLTPPTLAIDEFPCPRVEDCCRWFALRVATLDDSTERAVVQCNVVSHGEVRPFFGFNRAKHAVLEAAILATRIGILSETEIRTELDRLTIPVQKTAGDQERRAFDYLQQYVLRRLSENRP